MFIVHTFCSLMSHCSTHTQGNHNLQVGSPILAVLDLVKLGQPQSNSPSGMHVSPPPPKKKMFFFIVHVLISRPVSCLLDHVVGDGGEEATPAPRAAHVNGT